MDAHDNLLLLTAMAAAGAVVALLAQADADVFLVMMTLACLAPRERNAHPKSREWREGVLFGDQSYFKSALRMTLETFDYLCARLETDAVFVAQGLGSTEARFQVVARALRSWILH